jgi:hypothetical protein
MSGLAWFDDLGDATQHLALDDDVVHRITWRRGKLILEDHDVEAELALVALGGERCSCLDIADLFASPPPLHDLVKAGPTRRPATGYRASAFPPQGSRAFQNAMRHIPAAVVSRMQHDREQQAKRIRRQHVLQSVDGDLRRRLLAASSVAATRRGVDGYPDDWIGVNQFYGSELGPAVEWSLRGARRNLPVSTKVDFHLQLLEDEAEPSVDGVVSRGGGSIHVRIQPRWIADVWAHDLTLVDDSPVVAVKERTTVDSAWVKAIAWSRTRFELTEPRLDTLFIVRDELGFWHSATDRRAD